ncbi:MAG: transposase [Patescibacteria group bacterium]
MGKHHDAMTKEKVLLAIKNGESVAAVSVAHGVSSHTIYAWLRGQTDNTGTSALEIAKLRRENQELKEIIGWFTLKEKRGEKNQGR